MTVSSIVKVSKTAGQACSRAQRAEARRALAFTRYCFTSKLYWGSQSSCHCPPLLQSLPYCNTIARPMRNIRPPIDLPPFNAMHHTILVMAISCKGQVARCRVTTKRRRRRRCDNSISTRQGGGGVINISVIVSLMSIRGPEWQGGERGVDN